MYNTFKEFIKNNTYDTDKFSEHSYLDTYSELFNPIQKSVKNVLEVGVYKGHSLLLWRDFFSNAEIVGVDISDKELIINPEKENRILFYNCDAYTSDFINKFNYKFDIIIDDGNHFWNNVVWFVKYFPQILKQDGILIVEDIKGRNNAEKIKEFLPNNLKSKAHIIDLRDISNIKNDILLVVK